LLGSWATYIPLVYRLGNKTLLNQKSRLAAFLLSRF
jgi:hypothetical protein